MVIMINMNMCAVSHMCPTGIRSIPTGPITPVPRRHITVPCRPPEPIVDNRSININRLNDIVLTIDIRIANHLYRSGLFAVFLYIDGSHILENIFRQYGLYQYHMGAILLDLDYTQVINRTVAVQIQVAQMQVGIVEFLLKLLQVLNFAKQSCHCFQVQTFTNVFAGRLYGNRFIGFQPCSAAYQQGNQNKHPIFHKASNLIV